MELIVTLTLLLLATVTISNINLIIKKWDFSIHKNDHINNQIKYQLLLMATAFIVLTGVYFINQKKFFSYLRIGDITAPAQGVSWLKIGDSESWLSVGTSFTILITILSFSFVFPIIRKAGSNYKILMPYLPWIVLFSLTNSFAEEAIYRLGIIIPLSGVIETVTILIISAVTFGLTHIRGVPGGFIGVSMAAFLGWLLAKSVVETNGIFWAWSIHFFQDIVIFSALLFSLINKSMRTKTDTAS